VQTGKGTTVSASIMPGASRSEDDDKKKKKECGHKCLDKATCAHPVCCKRHLNLAPQTKGKGRDARGAATPAASAAGDRKIKVKKEPAPAPPPPMAVRRVQPPGGAQGGARARHVERLASVIQDIARRGSKSETRVGPGTYHRPMLPVHLRRGSRLSCSPCRIHPRIFLSSTDVSAFGQASVSNHPFCHFPPAEFHAIETLKIAPLVPLPASYIYEVQNVTGSSVHRRKPYEGGWIRLYEAKVRRVDRCLA
jgi:hypothetical protein